MSDVSLTPPATDPTPIFEFFRGSSATELLTAAVVEFDLFRRLAEQPLSFDDLRAEISLQRRPAVVLLTVLRAMGLITTDVGGIPEITDGTDTPLIASGNVPELTEALLRDLADPSEAFARAGRLRSHVADNFTVDRMTRDVVDLYRSVLV